MTWHYIWAFPYTGLGHKIVPLDELAMALIDLINDKKVRVFDKEESLLGVEKLLTRLLSEFDGNTEEMVQKLHQARDKQVLFDKSSICRPYEFVSYQDSVQKSKIWE